MKKIIIIIVILFMVVPIVEARGVISLYKEAKGYLEDGNEDFAFMIFRQISQDYPQSKYADEALFRIAKFYLDSNSFINAEDKLVQYIEEYPRGKFIKKAKHLLNKIKLARTIAKADSFYQKGDYKEAIEVYTQAMELTSEKKTIKDKINQCRQKHIKERIGEADKLYKDENWHKALVLYSKIIKDNPNLADIKEKIEKCKKNIEFEKKQIEKGLVKYKGDWVTQENLEKIVTNEMGLSSKIYVKDEESKNLDDTTWETAKKQNRAEALKHYKKAIFYYNAAEEQLNFYPEKSKEYYDKAIREAQYSLETGHYSLSSDEKNRLRKMIGDIRSERMRVADESHNEQLCDKYLRLGDHFKGEAEFSRTGKAKWKNFEKALAYYEKAYNHASDELTKDAIKDEIEMIKDKMKRLEGSVDLMDRW